MISRGLVTPGHDWLVERPLSQGQASFEELIAGKAEYTKIVLIP